MKRGTSIRGRKRAKRSKPPKSRRYCLACQKRTSFRYDKIVGHSRCCECGGALSKRFTPKEVEKFVKSKQKKKNL